MARVLLANDWRTPLGRFNRSVNGVPTEVPKNVLRRYPLPTGAREVGDDYMTPDEIEKENFGAVDDGLTAAEIEAEVNRRVNEELDAKLAARAAAADAKAKAKVVEENNDDDDDDDDDDSDDELTGMLDGSVDDVVSRLGELTLEELRTLLEAEQAGKTRKTLVVEIEAAIEDAEME